MKCKHLICAALIVLLTSLVAYARGIFPAALNTQSNISGWINWDELDEATLATDGVFVVLGNATADASDETGQGICTGLNLVFSQAGNPVASGTYRTLDGADDKFTMTNQWQSETIGGASSWTLVLKVRVDAGYDDRDTFIYCGGGANATVQSDINANKLYVTIDDNDSAGESKSTTDNITTGSDIYIAIWCNGVSTFAGFTSTRPIKWSDFPANQRVTFTNLYNNFDPTAWGGNLFETAGRWLKGRWYYLVSAKECLFDMNS